MWRLVRTLFSFLRVLEEDCLVGLFSLWSSVSFFASVSLFSENVLPLVYFFPLEHPALFPFREAPASFFRVNAPSFFNRFPLRTFPKT